MAGRRPASVRPRVLSRSRPLTATPGTRADIAPAVSATTEARTPACTKQGETDRHGRRHHERDAGIRRPFRASDPSLEPEDEALHPDRAQWALHHRSAPDPDLHRHRL